MIWGGRILVSLLHGKALRWAHGMFLFLTHHRICCRIVVDLSRLSTGVADPLISTHLQKVWKSTGLSSFSVIFLNLLHSLSSSSPSLAATASKLCGNAKVDRTTSSRFIASAASEHLSTKLQKLVGSDVWMGGPEMRLLRKSLPGFLSSA